MSSAMHAVRGWKYAAILASALALEPVRRRPAASKILWSMLVTACSSRSIHRT
jgi:hypothetical protein